MAERIIDLVRTARAPARGIAALAVVLLLSGCEAIRGPGLDPVGSMVAIVVPDEGIARVGPVTVQSGQTIQLHAVLEGLEGEETVYYTDAERLEIGGVGVPEDAMRPWPDHPIRCLWQTLEGAGPYIRIGAAEQLARIRFTNFSHPDWGLGCSVIAVITARQRETLLVPDDQMRLSFGRQNYQVWVEMLEKETDLVSTQSFKSPGSEALLRDSGSFPRVQMKLGGRLDLAAGVFGLSQLDPVDDLSEDARERIYALHREGLFFSRRLLLKDLLVGSGLNELDWQLIELDDGRPFVAQSAARDGRSVRPGDLLRVGNRLVILFRDVGDSGVLDSGDLCFDYERGAIVRRLGDIFVGDSDGDVDWASSVTIPHSG